MFFTHGMFSDHTSFNKVSPRIAAALPTHPLILLDMRNHGASPYTTRHIYPEIICDIQRTVQHLAGGEQSIFVGHSMGGIGLAATALFNHDMVAKLVVADVSPVPYTDRRDNFELIDYLSTINIGPGGLLHKADVESRLIADNATPVIKRFVLTSIRFPTHGPPTWKFNLPILHNDIQNMMDYRIPECKPYEGPTLYIRGNRSDYMRPEHLPETTRLFPNAVIVDANGGHFVHAEDPDAFVSRVVGFVKGGE